MSAGAAGALRLRALVGAVVRKFWQTLVVGPGLISERAIATWHGLTVNQPLLLVREPTNPVDPCAVVLTDLLGQPVGYVQRRVAAEVAPVIDGGTIVLGRVTRERLRVRHPPVASLWTDDGESCQHSRRRLRLPVTQS